MTEANWPNLRLLLEDNTDPLSVFRDLFHKQILSSAEIHVNASEPLASNTTAAGASLPQAPTPGGTDVLQCCLEQLDSPDWNVRVAAAESLSKLGPSGRAAMPYLMKTAEEENAFVREAAENTIRRIMGSG